MNTSKICFLIPSVASGGIEMYLLRFLNYIEDTSQITVLVRSSQKGELYEDYKKTGVQLKFLPLGYLSIPKTWQHYQYYKAQKFDVICDFNANFAGVPMVLSNILKVPKRIAFYRQGSNHFPPGFIKNRVNSFMNRLVFKNATHILSNSYAALDFFFPNRKASPDTYRDRFKVIYNGVKIEDYDLAESKASIRESLGIAQDAFVIGHAGRLDKAKNHDTILKVFDKVQQEHPNSFLVLCGRNIEKLESQLIDKGLREKTLLLGYRNDVPRILKSMDCFLFPSITEGQPNALIEAMVAGIPIVASNIPAILECVPKPYHHYLKKLYDIDGMAQAVLSQTQATFNKEAYLKVREDFDQNNNFVTFNKVING